MTGETLYRPKFRRIRSEDASAIAGLFETANADGGAGGWREKDIIRILSEGGAGVIAAAPQPPLQSQPIGAVLAMRAGDDLDIINIVVEKAQRRTGVGQRLLNTLLEIAIEQKYERLLLEVAEDNIAAIAFYTGLDFAIIGVRPAYYPRPGHRIDARVMARRLNF